MAKQVRDVNAAARLSESLSWLLEQMHYSVPQHLPRLVDEAARRLGATVATLFLADYEQTTLRPLDPSGSAEPFDIDGTIGGRAYCTDEPVHVPHEEGRRWWLPLLDGTDRLGVMALTFEHARETPLTDCLAFASAVAEIVVTRAQYSDSFDRRRRTQPLTLAAEMQRQVLPPLSFRASDVAVSAAIEPAYEVGGDAFDYAYDDGVLRLGLFDAMGHGTQASIMVSVAVGAYRHARRAGQDLADTCRAIDAAIDDQFDGSQSGRFVTAVLVELEAATGRLRRINAGLPQPVLLRSGREIQLPPVPAQLPLGLVADEINVHEDQLQRGDEIVFVTDGITEARRHDGVEFGRDRLVSFLTRQTASELPPSEIVRRLLRAVLLHHDSHLQDDASLVSLRWG